VAYDKIRVIVHRDCVPRICPTAVDEECKTVMGCQLWFCSDCPKVWHDRRCQYNVTFVQPLLQGRINNHHIFWVCICSLEYPACGVHASYCYLWPTRIDIIL